MKKKKIDEWEQWFQIKNVAFQYTAYGVRMSFRI